MHQLKTKFLTRFIWNSFHFPIVMLAFCTGGQEDGAEVKDDVPVCDAWEPRPPASPRPLHLLWVDQWRRLPPTPVGHRQGALHTTQEAEIRRTTETDFGSWSNKWGEWWRDVIGATGAPSISGSSGAVVLPGGEQLEGLSLGSLWPGAERRRDNSHDQRHTTEAAWKVDRTGEGAPREQAVFIRISSTRYLLLLIDQHSVIATYVHD